MAEKILSVRVRPPRVVVLLDKNAGDADVALAIRFFSRLWGGRYFQLLVVDPRKSDPLTEFRLSESRPEFVYGVGLDDTHWGEVVRRACQARRYCQLEQVFNGIFRQPRFENFITIDFAHLHLFEERRRLPGENRLLRLISSEGPAPWPLLCAATFGTVPGPIRPEYRDEQTAFVANTTSAFIDLATEFVTGHQQSWLDVTGHALSPHFYNMGILSPTIVLVDSIAQDISLFWNLRSATDAQHPAWIIPIPAVDATDPIVIDKLRAWLLAFLAYGYEPNHCKVTSLSVAATVCVDFAGRLQVVLADTPLKFVDYQSPRNHLPQVIPFEYETMWPVEIRGQKLTILPPKPRAFTELGSRAWVVDLLKDVKTGRAVQEAHFPSSPVVFELLNGPCPPSFGQFATNPVPRTGDGSVSINLYCSGSKEIINQYLPASEEVLEEILREHGYEPLPDEKRSSYLPVIRRFGGLSLAGKAFSGQSGVILSALADGKPRTIPEIQGACRLGGGVLSGPTYLERIEVFFTGESERMKRIGLKRFERYARLESPENAKLRSLLDFWTDRSVLVRHWKLSPCSRCNREYYEPNLNIQRPVLCPGCGHRIHLPSKVPIGYALHRSVSLAIQEGIMPVALTGRFLRGLTDRGFMWLPGVKYKHATECGDIDLVASCDGILVFCECKRLIQPPSGAKVWSEVIDQFIETAKVARNCQGHLAVLACQESTFPDEVRQEIESRMAGRVPYLLLDKNDLELGHRDIQEDSHKRWLRLGELLPSLFPETPRTLQGDPRTIKMGTGLVTFG